MAKPSFRWEKFGPERVYPVGFKKYGQAAVLEIRAIARYYSPQVEQWLKTHKKWVDRSANAVQGLFAEVEELTMGAVIILDHKMEYGVFLELGMGGRYQVILPALDYWSPIIWAEVKRRFS